MRHASRFPECMELQNAGPLVLETVPAVGRARDTMVRATCHEAYFFFGKRGIFGKLFLNPKVYGWQLVAGRQGQLTCIADTFRLGTANATQLESWLVLRPETGGRGQG
jgi:hypothetical protein